VHGEHIPGPARSGDVESPSVGVAAGDAEADRRAEVLDVQGEAIQAEVVEEFSNHRRDRFEGVHEVADGRRVGVAGAEVVGCDDAVPVG
jgi:hypothetical protein